MTRLHWPDWDRYATRIGKAAERLSMDAGWHRLPVLVSSPAMGMTDREARWAEALLVEKLHGERALLHVAERIGALALAGDVAGIERWKQIAACLDQIRSRSGSEPT